MPRSTCQGGIWRVTTRSLMARAHGPRLLPGQQRHRRPGAGPVAALARALEYRQHVTGERRPFLLLRRLLRLA